MAAQADPAWIQIYSDDKKEPGAGKEAQSD